MGFKCKDVTGQRFGKLTAVRQTEKRSASGSVIWIFKCDCGNTKEIQLGRVTTGNTKSCGCLRKQKRLWLRSDENEATLSGDIAILKTNGKHDAEFIIDREDYEKIKEYRWYSSPEGYIVSSDNVASETKSGKWYKKKIYLHRLIINNTENKHTDHIDRNKLNNMKENLRICTHSENFANRAAHKTYGGKPCTSVYKGVSKRKGGWVAQASFNGEKLQSHLMHSEKEAALKYNEFAKTLFDKYANLNDV